MLHYYQVIDAPHVSRIFKNYELRNKNKIVSNLLTPKKTPNINLKLKLINLFVQEINTKNNQISMNGTSLNLYQCNR